MLAKICGIRTVEAAKTAVAAGADMLGFVLADSKRQISPETAAEIIAKLPAHVQTVGVFVNETKAVIEQTARLAKFDYVQLHGQESPEFCAEMSFPVIKSFSIKREADLAGLKNYQCAYYLLDRPGVHYAGGSGVPLDWDLLQAQQLPADRIILAGGLTAGNVREAICKVNPAVVDVSSGVETNGQKDSKKITHFIRTVKT